MLALADAYGTGLGIPRTTVSYRVFGDGKIIGRVAVGHDITVRRAERAIRWFAAHWPAGCVWPGGVPGGPEVTCSSPGAPAIRPGNCPAGAAAGGVIFPLEEAGA